LNHRYRLTLMLYLSQNVTWHPKVKPNVNIMNIQYLLQWQMCNIKRIHYILMGVVVNVNWLRLIMKYLKWIYRIKCRSVRTFQPQIFIKVRGMLTMILKMIMLMIMIMIMLMIMIMIITTKTATITTNQIRIPQSTNLW